MSAGEDTLGSSCFICHLVPVEYTHQNIEHIGGSHGHTWLVDMVTIVTIIKYIGGSHVHTWSVDMVTIVTIIKYIGGSHGHTWSVDMVTIVTIIKLVEAKPKSCGELSFRNRITQ